MLVPPGDRAPRLQRLVARYGTIRIQDNDDGYC